MDPYWLGIIGAVSTVLFVFEMLRRGILRERFAALWLVISCLLLVVAIFPRLLVSAAQAFGVEVAANFLFFVSIIFLLLVAIQLSFEVSKLEGRTRRLAEDLALLRWEVRALGSQSLTASSGSAATSGTDQDAATGDQRTNDQVSATTEP